MKKSSTPHPTMTELTDYNDPTPDLTEEERTVLQWAGASEQLIEMCQVDVTEIERRDGKKIQRNSILEEIKKYLRGTPAIPPQLNKENAEEFEPYGGHFFTAMWEGDLYRAYSRADHNNKPVMLEVFGTGRINRDRPAHASEVEA